MRHTPRLLWMLAIAVLAGTGVAGAQAADAPASAYVETTTHKVDGPKKISLDLTDLSALDDALVAGDMPKARALATRIIDQAKDPAGYSEAYDYTKNYIALTWVASDPAGKLVARRLIVPQPVPRPHALDLPGVGSDRRLYELFVAGDERAALVTVYRSTPEENPLVKQIPTVATQIIGPLFGVVAGVAGEVRRGVRSEHQPAGPPAPKLYVTASSVVLPFRRAVVQAKTTAYLPKTLSRVTSDVENLAATLRVKDVAGYPCAQGYADTLKDKVTAIVKNESCSSGVSCLRAFDAAFTGLFAAAVKNCFPTAEPKSDELKAMKTVDGKFRDYVLDARDEVTAEVTFRNQPLTHVSFGAVTALAFEGSMTKPRVKLDDNGVVIADPLGRVLTMIAFNWSPRGYDRNLTEPSASERFRLFAGAIITPDFGTGGGLSVLLVRGLALNVGAGVVFSRAVPSETEIGRPPANAKDPFVLGTAPVVFVGASFNLK